MVALHEVEVVLFEGVQLLLGVTALFLDRDLLVLHFFEDFQVDAEPLELVFVDGDALLAHHGVV